MLILPMSVLLVGRAAVVVVTEVAATPEGVAIAMVTDTAVIAGMTGARDTAVTAIGETVDAIMIATLEGVAIAVTDTAVNAGNAIMTVRSAPLAAAMTTRCTEVAKWLPSAPIFLSSVLVSMCISFR